jgi:exonuclease SbcC
VIKEQISVGERERQELRKEYGKLKQELAQNDTLKQKFGQLEAQLENIGELNLKLKQVKLEKEKIEYSLSSNNYAQELQLERQSLDQELIKLNYDEQTHALVRGEVERLHWAEIKQAKLEEASRRQTLINQEKPKLLEQINQLKQELESLHTHSEIKQKITRLERDIAELGYDRNQHQELRTLLRQSEVFLIRYQKLEQAKQQYPSQKERLHNLSEALARKLNNQGIVRQELESLVKQIEQIPDRRREINILEQKIQQRRQKLDELLAQHGRLEQEIIQIETLKIQSEKTDKQLKEVRQKYLIYKELAQAFGKNGIQTLMIENILPALEAETNQILSRLTGNQLHIQFVTQKAGKSSSSKSKSAKLIDTLEILIADTRGTRPYETYSGGEAFRINFSIRLALARLLAQRAGTSLQMLIVDEGFGTQDSEGCERLIAAINAISADFSCILAVTHIPQFKEAFQHRIEVRKTSQGSQLSLST